MAALSISLGPRLGAIVDGSAVLNTYDLSDSKMQFGPSVQVAAPIEHVAWSATGTYAVLADANGGLNFVLESGKVLFRHALVKVESGTYFFLCLAHRRPDYGPSTLERVIMIAISSTLFLIIFLEIACTLP